MWTRNKLFSIILIFLITEFRAQKYEPDYHGYFLNGPCESYLNFLNYSYLLSDLKKDTLKFPYTKDRLGAEFYQKGTKLISAKFFDKNNNVISSGNFSNGNGKIIIKQRGDVSEFTFKDSCLNDTTKIVFNKYSHDIFIFKDNSLIKRFYLTNTTGGMHGLIENFDQGVQHDTTFIFGNPQQIDITPFFRFSFDPSKGSLIQADIYNHGIVIERVFYNKDGSIKKKEKNKQNLKPKLNHVI